MWVTMLCAFSPGLDPFQWGNMTNCEFRSQDGFDCLEFTLKRKSESKHVQIGLARLIGHMLRCVLKICLYSYIHQRVYLRSSMFIRARTHVCIGMEN